jgi:hypothetical protein
VGKLGKLSKLGKLGEPARAHVLPGSFWNESAGYVPLPSKGEAERQPGPRNADSEMGANPCPGKGRDPGIAVARGITQLSQIVVGDRRAASLRLPLLGRWIAGPQRFRLVG